MLIDSEGMSLMPTVSSSVVHGEKCVLKEKEIWENINSIFI